MGVCYSGPRKLTQQVSAPATAHCATSSTGTTFSVPQSPHLRNWHYLSLFSGLTTWLAESKGKISPSRSGHLTPKIFLYFLSHFALKKLSPLFKNAEITPRGKGASLAQPLQALSFPGGPLFSAAPPAWTPFDAVLALGRDALAHNRGKPGPVGPP